MELKSFILVIIIILFIVGCQLSDLNYLENTYQAIQETTASVEGFLSYTSGGKEGDKATLNSLYTSSSTNFCKGDFNDDYRTDVAQFDPATGSWWVSLSTGSSFTTTRWANFSTNSGWTSHVVGDFNGDGRDDIANFHPSNGTWWVCLSTGSSFSTTLWADL